jgi:phosphoribosylpyrophosphate synthetase
MKTIITHPNFNPMGEELEARNPVSITHAKIRFESFPDGWPNLFIEDVKEKIEHKEVTYIGDFSRPEYLFPNYAIIRGILDYYADKVRVIIPYFPVGTMERISKK